MKISLFCLFCFLCLVRTEGYAQLTTSAPQPKPKIASKSVAVSNPASVKSTTAAPKSKSTGSLRTAKIRFDQLKMDLGTIKEDAVVEKVFEFTNVGDRELVILNAKGSCGCTSPTVPVAPIAPGEKGKILVKYTAKNKAGPQKPTVTVTTNGAPSVVKLQMEVWVEQIPGGVN